MIFIKGEVIKRPPTEFEKAGYTKSNGMLRIKEPNVAHNLLNTEVVFDTFYVRNFWTKSISFSLEKKNNYITEIYRNFGAELMPGQEGFFVLKYDASARNSFGQVKDMITFQTNDSIEPVKRIHYANNIQEDFSKLSAKQLKNAPVCVISTDSVGMGNLQKNTARSETLRVTNTGKSPLIIRNLETSIPMFSAASNLMTIPAGGSAEITVTLKAPSRASSQNATLDIITNDPANPVRTVKLSAKIL